MYIVISVVSLALIIFALVDVITSDDLVIRHLPKIGWIVLIVLLPLIGSIVWLIAGKQRRLPIAFAPEQPGAAAPAAAAPSTTEQELAALEREIERAEKAEKLRRLEAEVQRRKGTSQA